MVWRPIIRLDFDGVIHSYVTANKPWRDEFIPDPVTDGFWEWALDASIDADLVIFSSRCKTAEGRAAIERYLEEQWKLYDEKISQIMPIIKIVSEPVPAFVTIDDRGLTFRGNWADFPIDMLLSFKPWNK